MEFIPKNEEEKISDDNRVEESDNTGRSDQIERPKATVKVEYVDVPADEYRILNSNANDEVCLPTHERIVYPQDVLIKPLTVDDEVIDIIGTRVGKVTRIGGLEQITNLKVLILRSCLISTMEGLNTLVLLEKLELYDNQIEYIQGINLLQNLKILDLSFNSIRSMEAVRSCPMLQELYIAQNKLRKMEGLTNLSNLSILDLGANRIRDIEGLENCTNLKSLWLGKNKIEYIQGLETLHNMQILDVQSNRLTSIGNGLQTLSAISELYLASNAIENLEGLPQFNTLTTVDLSYNKISNVSGVEVQTQLEELWMSNSLLSNFSDLQPLFLLPNLKCLYLEHSPIAKDFEYRMFITKSIKSLVDLDADPVNRH
eukprot:gene4513-6377_t